ncbi:MAG: regulatory protein RecX [Clostridiaceae bacterium]
MQIKRMEPAIGKKGYVTVSAAWEEHEVNLTPQDWSDLMQDPDSPQFLLSQEVAFRRSLRPGSRIELTELQDLIREDELVKAREAGLHLLDVRMRTRKEVRDKLKEKDFSDRAIEATLESLASYGFLDDEKFAQAYLKERIRQRGSRAIEQELFQKGVDREIAQDLLEDMSDAEESHALAACRKKVLSLKNRGLEENKIREKVYRFLLSRGYDYNLIKKVYNMTLEQAEEE